MSDPQYIERPPRIQPELPHQEFEIPAPPEQEDKEGFPVLHMILPIFMILGYVLVFAAGGRGGNPIFILPMVLYMVASVGGGLVSFWRNRNESGDTDRAYARRLQELRQEMLYYHDMQRRFYYYNYPGRETVLEMATDLHKAEPQQRQAIRSGTRLWERRATDEDFGMIRLGMGTIPSTVIYQFSGEERVEDGRVREALRLDADSRQLAKAPVLLSLRPPPAEEAPAPAGPTERTEEDEESGRGSQARIQLPAPVSHALGVSGRSAAVRGAVRAWLMHFLAFHAPAEARLYLLGRDAVPWEWTFPLPHCTAGAQAHAYLYFEQGVEREEEEQRVAEDRDAFLEGLRQVLSRRQLLLRDSENSGESDPRLPFLLLVVDRLDGMAGGALEEEAAISLILQDGPELGAAVIFLEQERRQIPSGCTAVVEVEETVRKTGSAPVFRYAEVGVNSWRYVGEADFVAQEEAVQDFARSLENRDVRRTYGASLATASPFLPLLGYTSLRELREEMGRRWERSKRPRDAGWLAARVGLMASNKRRTLRFSASQDGVHGMVAGSTGSGKSELLITLIMSMAVQYDPSVLNFVLVDYKGGGAFQEFTKLPHCVDVITNLQAGGVSRMFTAIRSELERRQHLLGKQDIVDYNRHRAADVPPLPFLFIIIDEFAEMLADSTEYRAQLESITRIGRALGVTLILAAQRPSGVTDQMRSNIKLRICLRVENPEESREILRRADAAYLPSGIPGRGYLQVGNDNLDAIQVGYAGYRYMEDPVPAVRWPERWAQQGRPAVEDREPPKLYSALIELAAQVAKEEGCPVQHAPWPKALPGRLLLSEPPQYTEEDGEESRYNVTAYLQDNEGLIHQQPDGTATAGGTLILNPFVRQWLEGGSDLWARRGLDWAQYGMRPVAGLVDDPHNAVVRPLEIRLREGHVAIFGDAGWGKTTLVRTLLLSLAATHSPEQLHIYVLDLGGRNLGVVGRLPHIGAVILPDEEGYEEQVQYLLRELEEIVNRRKDLFNEAQIDGDLYAYNQHHPQQALPAVLLVIDNFVEFKENFGEEKDGQQGVLESFITLARQCKRYGIHILVTVHQLNVLSGVLYSLFTERLTLMLSDPADYRAVTGRGVGPLAEIPGRGYVKLGQEALECQIALPAPPDDLVRLVELLQAHGAPYLQGNKRRLVIEPLPRSVTLKRILHEDLQREAATAGVATPFSATLLRLMQRNWDSSIGSGKAADWLRAPLGIVSGGQVKTLHFAFDKDGVHGMIAGSTGSGKSELLMSLIVSMAVLYDPSILNFVLVDYKGGGAFQPFHNLPHCVDIITNLQAGGAERMFTAINAELKRRQKLTTDTGTKDIIDYRRKGLHRTREPFPHLFIIIDEYAEMITDKPDFRAELDRITRVGRSAGVHLLLAAQRPTGVSDQMRSNIRFRICLRVENIDESREMLRRSDAAFLPGGAPGRGYLQVGNEELSLIQVVYTGEREPAAYLPPLLWPSRESGALEADEAPRLFELVVDLAAALAAENDDELRRPRRPWPDFLSPTLTLETPIPLPPLAAERELLAARGIPIPAAGSHYTLNPAVTAWINGEGAWRGVHWGGRVPAGQVPALRPVLGLLDNPHEARQEPLQIRLDRAHLALFGDAGWGKTTFLRTLLVSLVTTHTPHELHVYLLDLGGRNFQRMTGLPHVGAVIMPSDEAYEERIQRLFDQLSRLIIQRQELFGQQQVTSFAEYNRKHPEDVEPAVLILIDNFAELSDSFGSLIENTLIPLMRNCLSYGIHFAITANAPNAMPSKLYNLFAEKLTLNLVNEDLYADIVGRGPATLQAIPGRAYVRVDRHRQECQLAQPVGVAAAEPVSSAAELQDLERLLAQLQAVYQEQQVALPGRPPQKIEILAEEVALLDVLREAQGVEGQSAEGELAAVLGRDVDLRPACFDLGKQGPHFLIMGPPLSGKTTTLWNWVLSLAFRYPPERLKMILVDFQRRLFEYGEPHNRRLDELPHVVAAIADLEQLSQVVARLEQECLALEARTATHRIHIIIDNYDDLAAELDGANGRDLSRQLDQLVRRYGTRGLHLIAAGALLDGSGGLKRAIQGSRYGIGLRTAGALDKLSVFRSPAGLRDNELAVGRGYAVKSGQTRLLQVAAPYLEPGAVGHAVEVDDSSALIAGRLDSWVEQIMALYPAASQESWLGEILTEASPEQLNGHVAQMAQLLNSFLQLEGQEQVAAGELVEALLKRQLLAKLTETGSEIAEFLEEADVASLLLAAGQHYEELLGREPAGEGTT